MRRLEQLERVNSKTLMVVNTIRGHRGLASREDMQSVATNLSLNLGHLRELRSQLAKQLSAYLAAPRSPVWNVLSLRWRRLVGKEFDHLSLEIERNRELTDQVMALLEGDQKDDSLP